MKVLINAAVELAQGNEINHGRGKCRIKPLEKSKQTSYRCQKSGHMAINGTGEQKCYKCNKTGHLARDCTGLLEVESA